MLSRINTSALKGVTRYDIAVEVDTSPGLPSFDIVGLPDASLREARERVRSAINNSNQRFPMKRVTVGLSPADTKKAGTSFDLPIALGVLSSCGIIPDVSQVDYLAIGELGLDGSVRSIPGALAMVFNERRKGVPTLVPRGNMVELGLLEGYNLLPISSLGEAIWLLNSGLNKGTEPMNPVPSGIQPQVSDVDLADVVGMFTAKRALEVAASGGHHMFIAGPPGIGKSLLARSLRGILPELELTEMIEAAGIHSCAGVEFTYSRSRPLRSPHHLTSATALLGGGIYGAPGEVALAHKGVLLLDEFPEFRRDCIEALRQPLEEGSIVISRSKQSYSYPCDFQLVATSNLCPCGNFGLPEGKCRCTMPVRRRYLGKVSGPILDRMDIMITTRAQSLFGTQVKGEDSVIVRDRVSRVRQHQMQLRGMLNCKLSFRQLMDNEVSPEVVGYLGTVTDNMAFSHRAQLRLLRVARTIADMDGVPEILSKHLNEAVGYRIDTDRM